jgi:hypothetical protein
MTAQHEMTYTALDALKYCTAEGKSILEYVEDSLGSITSLRPLYEDEVETLQSMLESVRKMLIQTTSMFCRDGDDFNTYSDGRRVETSISTEKGNIFSYRWHPDRLHRDNQPHTLVDRCEGTSGAQHAILVAADQILDTVHHGRCLHLVEDPDETPA